MLSNLPQDWKELLHEEIEKRYFQELIHFVKKEYEENTCYPEEQYIFAAFELCPLENVKVVILGQDPYHGAGQAHGLCFSVKDDVKIPPSLRNIFKELQTDLDNEIPSGGNLEHWAKQGVLLLNATLTVRAGKAGSHQKQGWEKFTNAVIEQLSQQKEHLVFLLWGGPAKKKGTKIDSSKHLVLTSGHPSPLSANRGYWFGNRHFSRTNDYLNNWGKSEIDW